MPIGKIITLVHLSQQTYQPTSRLIASHNDKGYGTLRDHRGRKVYFSHDAVPGRRGFDDLRPGQSVEYTVDPASKVFATLVEATIDPTSCQVPRVETAEEGVTRFRHIVRTFQRPFPPPARSHHPLDGYPRDQ